MQTTETLVPITDNSLPPSLLSNIETGFREAFAKAQEWREKALAIRVTSIDQKAEMQMARIARIELKNIRVAAEKTRKALKEDSLRMGKAIDGVNNLLLAAIEPLERHLEEQEQFAERLKAAEKARILTERTEAIAPYVTEGQAMPPLDSMTDEQWAAYLEDTKLLHTAKIEAAQRAEAERIAREQAEAAERERVRLENEKLKKEAAEREAQMKAEREAAAKAQAELEAKARAEREAATKKAAEAEAKAKAEREAIEAKAKAEREAAEKAQREAAEKARKEREDIEAKARAERIERERLEAEIAAKKAAEEAAQAKAAAEAAKAARAPDKAKVKGIAATVRAISFPSVSTPEAEKVLADIQAKAESFAKWIETQAATL